jgi:hypothetical protein
MAKKAKYFENLLGIGLNQVEMSDLGAFHCLCGLTALLNLLIQRLSGCFPAVGDSQKLVDPHGLVANGGDAKAQVDSEIVVGFASKHHRGIDHWGMGYIFQNIIQSLQLIRAIKCIKTG